MKCISEARWGGTLQYGTLLFALTLGATAIIYNATSLFRGIKLIWNSSGYASLILAPLTFLLATAMLREVTDRNPDRKTLNKRYGIVASIAPMSGFLGTVLGIMGAVQALGKADNVESLIGMVDHIFSKMGIAFTTTAWGLILAMVAVLILGLRAQSTPSQAEQLQQIITLLQAISSDLNTFRPCVSKRVARELDDGGK